ncbi:adenylosuccinate lyase [Candidatus Marinamargulisbacteria bacterium SCGC AG-410-N11]|nr:adenylosuccinate lyase [Candidatus Marinamargulisbacteria bacterium SCGC AG-410-N11]
MISRYSTPKMKQIWTLENKFNKWLDVELAACKAHVKLGNIPQSDYDIIVDKAAFSVDRINEIESEIHHDVIAFLTNIAENVGESSRFVHLGLTSSDVVDTAFSLLIKESGDILLETIDILLSTLKTQAYNYKTTLIMGRTHGVHAEPTTFGLKLTIWYEELKRNKERLISAIESINVGKLSGAVGNYAHMPPSLEKLVCDELGLKTSSSSNQILQRDRHAHFVTTLAIIAGTLEKMATEIRGLQKTEFNEITEPFSKKQKGSSAMPHKKNPIICERISGLARTIRGYALTALENQNLWHERDISHSSTERIIFPDATVGLDYMMIKMIDVIKNMVINEDQMKENIERSYKVFFSQQLLLKMIEKGMSREKAYRIVQRNAHDAFNNKVPFESKIEKDPDILSMFNQQDLDSIFSYDCYIQHVDFIYKRVFN